MSEPEHTIVIESRMAFIRKGLASMTNTDGTNKPFTAVTSSDAIQVTEALRCAVELIGELSAYLERYADAQVVDTQSADVCCAQSQLTPGKHSTRCPTYPACLQCGESCYPDSSYKAGYRHIRPSLHGAEVYRG